MKTCTRCGEEKELSEYTNAKRGKDGRNGACKSCESERGKKYRKENADKVSAYRRKHRENNKEYLLAYVERNKVKISERKKVWRHNNRERLKEMHSKRYLANVENVAEWGRKYRKENAEKISKRRAEYRRANKEKIAERSKTEQSRLNRSSWDKRKRRTDTAYWVKGNLRNRVACALRSQAARKSAHTHELLGASIQFVLEHLQATATQNGYLDFDINNYSGKEYHIDHIIPCASFDLTNKEEQKICFHYSNLQILSAEENMSKHDKIEGEVQYSLPI